MQVSKRTGSQQIKYTLPGQLGKDNRATAGQNAVQEMNCTNRKDTE